MPYNLRKDWIPVPSGSGSFEPLLDNHGRRWQGPYRFSEEGMVHAKKGPGIYLLFDTESRGLKLRYIGCAYGQGGVRTRLRAHLRQGSGANRLVREADLSTCYYAFWLCGSLEGVNADGTVVDLKKADQETAREVEAHFLAQPELPPFNLRHEYKHYRESITYH